MAPCGRTCNSTRATWPRVQLAGLIHLPTALIWCSWLVPFLCHTAPSAPTYHFQGGSPLKHVSTWHVRFICPKVGACHVVARHLVHTILKYFQNLTWKFLANWIWKIFVEIPIGFNITVKLPCKLPRSLLIIFSLIDITRRGPGPANDTDNLIKIYGTVFEKIDIITFPHVNPMGNSGVNYPKVG